jgi:hypothetical protein
MRYVNGYLTLSKKEIESLKFALTTLEGDMGNLAATQADFPDKKWLRDSTNAYKTVKAIALQLGAFE